MEPPAFPRSGVHTTRAAPGSEANILLPLPTGTPPFTYEWSRAGATLDGRFRSSVDANGVRLTVSAAQIGDSGVYTLQASNAAGKDTTRVSLEVSPDEAPTGEDPPTFLRRLQDLTVKVGTRTRFLVEILSSTECKVTWYRNERRLLEAERIALVRDGNFWCADVATVSVDDAGRWTCTAENLGGRASCSAHLNVLVPKAYKRPEFVEELRAILTEQGTVSLECKVVGVPTPVLRWFKDSREIKAGDVFALTANADDPTSLGTYTCEAINCMGRAYSSSKVHVIGRSKEGSARPSSGGLTPDPPPIFTKELEDQFVRICDPLTLSCHIVVPPWPRSTVWYNKEGKIDPSTKYHILEDGVGGYMVEISGAEWADEGEWKCVATSAGGRVGISTCNVTMDVPKNYRKPRFMENLQAVLTEEGLVSFECKVVGFPTPVLSWFKDGQELKPGDVYQLTGTNSLGSYCCIAKNCMGHASSSAELTVEDIQNQLNEEEKLQLFSKNQAPKFLQGLKSVEVKIDEPFRFTIKVAIPPEPTVLWYRDDQPVDESPRCHLGKEDRGVFYLDIKNLELMDQTEWKCVAMNDFGHSVTSCFLKLIIPRHFKKPRFLENLQAILSDEGAVNLECKVIGVPQPVLKWYKDGEELKPGDIHRIISGQDGTCCLGTYTCEAQNCMGISASSASLLGFEDTVKAKKKKSDDQALQRNLSLSTIHEERTSQMYDTPVADVTLDDKGEISFSFDGKEVSVSLYETPDLTEEEALQIVEMYADQLSENVTEHNVIELPPLRFVKETSTSGNLLMEAIIIDVSPDYFVSPEEDLRTEADIEDISIAEEIGQAQLSFDQEVSVDYIEKTMALISEEKSDIPKVLRRKSDSQKSGENYFSLSKDQSLSEEKKDDDDTQVLSESVSFASAQSTGKQKSKPSQDDEVGTQESDVTKTVLLREEQRTTLDTEIKLISKTNVTNQEEKHNIDPVVIKNVNEDLTYISSVLSKVMNDIQVMERDIILKSQLMSTAAVAAKSLEIITSIIKPLNDIHSITDAVKETINEASELNPVLFTKLPIFLKELQIALAMVEKCIDVGSDKTLIKNTCISVINNCEEDVTKLVTKIKDFALVNKLYLNSELVAEVQSLSSDILNVIEISRSTVATKSILIEDIKNEEVSIDKQHLNRTQKAVYNLKIPLTSLLNIVENALKVNFDTVLDINNAEVILFNMSSSIQDLQTALEHIEFLSVEESNSPLQKYNTNVIETVMGSVLKLRNSFENLSVEKEKREDKEQLNNVLQMISVNLNKISSDIKNIEGPIGAFDILYEDNKLEILQRMAHILISLENSLPILIGLPNIQSTLSAFHKNLTKALENTIESNDMNKYSTLVSICDVVNRINESIKNVQCSQNLSLACIGSNFSIIEEILKNKSIDYVSDQDLLTNARQYCIDIQSIITYTDDESIKIESERVEDITSTSPFFPESKANVVLHQIDHVISVINNISLEETASSISAIIPVLQKSCPILEELKYSVAALTQNAKEYESSLSEISDFSAAESFGKSLQELHENITTLNQVLLESMEDIKIKEDISNVFAKPIHELHTTLQILQENILSQCELYSPVHLSNKVATTELVLQNCILLVKEENEIEPIEELSTLEDISCIKTTAESILADELLLPITDEAFVEQAPPLIEIKSQKPEIAHVFQLLHNDIIDIQKLDILETLNILSEVKEYANLKSATETIVELQNKIIGILSPLLMESLTSVSNLDIVSNDIVTISNSLLRLKNHLCVIDMNNIPIYEDVLQLPSEEIYIIVKKINNLKNHLDECLTAIHDIKEIPELDKQLDALRRQCRELKTIVTEPLNVDLSFESIQCLNKSVDIFLQATESLANNDTVQNVGGQLLKDILIVQDELVDYVSVKENIEENLVVNTINNITVNLAALEQYNIHIYDTLDINIETKFDINAEYDNLIHMKHLIDESEIVVIKELTQKSESADMIIVEDFFKKIKSNFHNLQVLLHQNPSHKKVIRILQEYFALQANINDFKTEMVTLNITQNIQQSLNNFFSQTDNSLEKIKISLLKLTSSLSNTLFKKPLEKLEYSMVQLPECLKLDHLLHLHGLVQNFVLILNIAFPHLENLENVVNKELQMSLFINSESEDNLIIEAIDNFISFLEQETSVSDNAERKLFLIKMLTCSQNHQNYKIALGTGKKMIIMKYLADCSDLLQHHLEDIDKTLATKQKSLQTILNEQIRLLHILHGEVIHLKEQPERSKQEIAAIESCVESIIRLNKSIQDCSNSEKIQSAHQNISLLKDIICQTNTIQDSLDSLKCSTKDISSISSCLDDIKNVVYSISPVEHKLSKQEANVLLQHVEQYIEVTEIIEEISAVLNLGNVQEAKIVAEELRESIAKAEVIPENEEYIEYHLVTEHQENLAQRLQKSLTDIQEQAIENNENLISCNENVKHHILEVITQLKDDLNTITSVEINEVEFTDESKMVKSKVDVGQGNKKPQDLPELETNSVINYDANSLGLDGEYNNNEVQSKEMNSKISYEECQNFSTTSFEGSNADEVVHQLENTILSITNISAEEIPTGIPSLYPTLESICPILEDLKLSIASLNQNSQDSELNLSDISENSVELIFGKPLHDLEEHVSVLNHILFESVKDHSGLEDVQRLGILVKPLHELHTTYQILQENVISQYESLSTLHGDNNIASIKEILQSCVLLVEEQHGLEVVDDISTLEDISCIKTSADSVCSDALQLADELQVGLEDSREIIEQDKNDDLASGTTSIQAGDIIKNIEASIETKEDLRNSSFEVCDAETMFMEPPISSALPCDITTADVVLTPEMEINNIVHEQITDIQIDLTQQPEEKMQMCDNRVELEDSLKCEIKNDTNESLENNNLHETNTKILSEKSSADQCNVDLNKEEIETKVKTKQPSKVAEPVETFDEMHTNDGLNIVSDMPEAIQCEMDDEIEKEATINVQKLQASGEEAESANDIQESMIDFSSTKSDLEQNINNANNNRADNEKGQETKSKIQEESISESNLRIQSSNDKSDQNIADVDIESALSNEPSIPSDPTDANLPSQLDNNTEAISNIKKEIVALDQRDESIKNNQKDIISSTESETVEDMKPIEVIINMKTLMSELQENVMHATINIIDNSDIIHNILDEFQVQIIKLKSVSQSSDNVAEILNDLECSTRSVQLLVSENSPLQHIMETTATLEVLVDSIKDDFENYHLVPHNSSKDNTVTREECVDETNNTLMLLEKVSKSSHNHHHIENIINELNCVKGLIIGIKQCFNLNEETIIEKGIDLMQNLDIVEQKLFTIENTIESISKVDPTTRDTILTAVHSVYANISNIRGTITNIQRRYMYENYGKPSEMMLKAIKNINILHKLDKKDNWKQITKHLRNTLNHFEDIKFFINLDKTARVPSDASLTKVVLNELKLLTSSVMLKNLEELNIPLQKKINCLVHDIEQELNKFDNITVLNVSEKIPIFKQLSLHFMKLSDVIVEAYQLRKDVLLSDRHGVPNENKINDSVQEVQFSEAEALSTKKISEPGTIVESIIEPPKISKPTVSDRSKNNNLPDDIFVLDKSDLSDKNIFKENLQLIIEALLEEAISKVHLIECNTSETDLTVQEHHKEDTSNCDLPNKDMFDENFKKIQEQLLDSPKIETETLRNATESIKTLLPEEEVNAKKLEIDGLTDQSKTDENIESLSTELEENSTRSKLSLEEIEKNKTNNKVNTKEAIIISPNANVTDNLLKIVQEERSDAPIETEILQNKAMTANIETITPEEEVSANKLAIDNLTDQSKTEINIKESIYTELKESSTNETNDIENIKDALVAIPDANEKDNQFKINQEKLLDAPNTETEILQTTNASIETLILEEEESDNKLEIADLTDQSKTEKNIKESLITEYEEHSTSIKLSQNEKEIDKTNDIENIKEVIVITADSNETDNQFKIIQEELSDAPNIETKILDTKAASIEKLIPEEEVSANKLEIADLTDQSKIETRVKESLNTDLDENSTYLKLSLGETEVDKTNHKENIKEAIVIIPDANETDKQCKIIQEELSHAPKAETEILHTTNANIEMLIPEEEVSPNKLEIADLSDQSKIETSIKESLNTDVDKNSTYSKLSLGETEVDKTNDKENIKEVIVITADANETDNQCKIIQEELSDAPKAETEILHTTNASIETLKPEEEVSPIKLEISDLTDQSKTEKNIKESLITEYEEHSTSIKLSQDEKEIDKTNVIDNIKEAIVITPDTSDTDNQCKIIQKLSDAPKIEAEILYTTNASIETLIPEEEVSPNKLEIADLSDQSKTNIKKMFNTDLEETITSLKVNPGEIEIDKTNDKENIKEAIVIIPDANETNNQCKIIQELSDAPKIEAEILHSTTATKETLIAEDFDSSNKSGIADIQTDEPEIEFDNKNVNLISRDTDKLESLFICTDQKQPKEETIETIQDHDGKKHFETDNKYKESLENQNLKIEKDEPNLTLSSSLNENDIIKENIPPPSLIPEGKSPKSAGDESLEFSTPEKTIQSNKTKPNEDIDNETSKMIEFKELSETTALEIGNNKGVKIQDNLIDETERSTRKKFENKIVEVKSENLDHVENKHDDNIVLTVDSASDRSSKNFDKHSNTIESDNALIETYESKNNEEDNNLTKTTHTTNENDNTIEDKKKDTEEIDKDKVIIESDKDVKDNGDQKQDLQKCIDVDSQEFYDVEEVLHTQQESVEIKFDETTKSTDAQEKETVIIHKSATNKDLDNSSTDIKKDVCENVLHESNVSDIAANNKTLNNPSLNVAEVISSKDINSESLRNDSEDEKITKPNLQILPDLLPNNQESCLNSDGVIQEEQTKEKNEHQSDLCSRNKLTELDDEVIDNKLKNNVFVYDEQRNETEFGLLSNIKHNETVTDPKIKDEVSRAQDEKQEVSVVGSDTVQNNVVPKVNVVEQEANEIKKQTDVDKLENNTGNTVLNAEKDINIMSSAVTYDQNAQSFDIEGQEIANLKARKRSVSGEKKKKLKSKAGKSLIVDVEKNAEPDTIIEFKDNDVKNSSLRHDDVQITGKDVQSNDTLQKTQTIGISRSVVEESEKNKLFAVKMEDKVSVDACISNKSINASASKDAYKEAEILHIRRNETYIPREKPQIVDPNIFDSGAEFSRPPGYIPKSYNTSNTYTPEINYSSTSNVFYKAQSLVRDHQARFPPDDLYVLDKDRQLEIRQKAKAASESRSIYSEKRSSTRDLKRKPVFSTHLTNRTAVEGSRVKLTCSVLSSTESVINWYKNGVLLEDKQKYKIKFLDGLITMELLNALPIDSGDYSCTVENEHGSITTSAKLKVYPSFEATPIPPTFTRSIRDVYHRAENELVMECRIRGQPLPTITWLKDNKSIASMERYEASYLADGLCRLTVSAPTADDSGTFTCKAESAMWSDQISHVVNFSGAESRISCRLSSVDRRHVHDTRRPHFTNVLSDYKVVKGGTIGLQVEIGGAPTRVEWLREGSSVTEIDKNAQTFVDHGIYTLALTDVTEKHSGLYTCRAWSNHGNVDMNADILVVQPNEVDGKPPVIVSRPAKDLLLSVGEDINISFRVQGEPKPKVFFMKGIRDITNSQRVCKMTSDDYVKFTLKRSVISDAGTYCILARNAYGCDRAFVTVVVRQRASSENLISDWIYPIDDSAILTAERKYKTVPGRIPGEPSAVDGGNSWVTLAWPKPDPNEAAPVLAYRVDSWLLGKEGGARWLEMGITPRNTFDAFNLKQGEEYHFRVTPRNRYGFGEPVQTSSPIGVGVAGDRPEFVDILPGLLKVLVGETANLSCSFKGKPTPEIVWMKNGHELDEASRIKTKQSGNACSLTIKKVEIEDEGRYSCEATNAHGRASTYARMTVITDKQIWEADAKLKRERSADATGDYPPQFTMRLRDRRVQATYPVRLTCQVIGSPTPTLTWFKDGQEIVFDSRKVQYQDEHFHTLEIAPTTLDDGGVYEALARNNSGAVSCRCCLVVDKGIRAYVAPEFCCGLEPLYRLNEGEELRISAIVEAYPSVGVTWYRDGVRLRPSRKAVMTLDRDGQIELALASVTTRDAGVYTCTASNEVGQASTSGKVEIVTDRRETDQRKLPTVICSDVPYSKEPMFIKKPRSTEAYEGDTVIIECEVIGDPTPDVYWLRDFLKPDYYRDAIHFKQMAAGPLYRFEIPHAKLDFTGAYSVVARNVHGEAKAIISLQIFAKDPKSSDETHNIRYGRVEVLPRFEKDLTDLLCYDGDAVEFECRVTGNPEPDIRWFHYNEVLPNCPDFESTFDVGTARLKIKQVAAEDEGTYTCEASNNLGKATSTACLVVYPPGEPNTLSQRLQRPPALASTTSTPRSTPRATPSRSVSRTPAPRPGTSKETPRLRSPTREVAPKFYTYPFNKVVEEGDSVILQCGVGGLPTPWATWDKDGIIITPTSRISIKEKDEMLRILQIDEVTVDDVGLYRITLENDYGRAEASARVEVISQKGKFYARSCSGSPARVSYRRRTPSLTRQD